ncbi:MAG TPA: hypothetical protein VJK72_00950 [Candidatus Nanoarchaeia archaeon]|nr:hypothetical protein [Candidatus Nanoarchaeia archaeon]
MGKETLLFTVMLVLILWSLLFAVQGEILQNQSDSLEVMLLGNSKIMAGIYLLLLGILVALLLLPLKMREQRK